jgi:hypothetical protein
MAVNPAGDPLPCGRHIDQLWDQLAGGMPNEHAQGCEHCQAALTGIRPLLAATSQLAAEPVSSPDDLAGRVMAVIRARIHPAPRIPLPGPAGMRLDISEHAAAFILRAAGDTVDGVRARSCRLSPAAHDGSTATGLQLTISLRYGVPALTAARWPAAARRQYRAAPVKDIAFCKVSFLPLFTAVDTEIAVHEPASPRPRC